MTNLFKTIILSIFIFSIYGVNTTSATFFKPSMPMNKLNPTIEKKIEIKKEGNEKINEILAEEEDSPSNKKTDVNIGDIFNEYSTYFDGNIPEEYKYVNVKMEGIEKGTQLHDSIQKMIYSDLIQNDDIETNYEDEITAYNFYKVSGEIFETDFDKTDEKLKNRNANEQDLKKVRKELTNKYIEKEDENKIYDLKEGEFDGIGAALSMKEKGVLKVEKILESSPAKKAGLQKGDIIVKIDWKEIKEENTLNQAISWIRGPKYTNVYLTVERNKEKLKLEINRKKIIIK